MNALKTAFVMIGVLFLAACSDTADLITSKKAAVVAIVAEKNNQSDGKVGIGTGWFLKENYIVTNYHVAGDSKQIKIAAEDGDLSYDAEYVYGDEFADIAVLRVKDWDKFKKAHKPIYLKFADRDSIRQAEEVYAIGHPWGLTWSISRGIISSELRRKDVTPNYFLQTDAHVFQGNSGGPLINTRGEVVGVNNQMVANTGGSFGLAIPSAVVQKVLSDLEAYKEVRWTSIGVLIDETSVVTAVAENKPAKIAGLKPGDKIVGYQYKNRSVSIRTSDHLVTEIGLSKINEPFHLYVIRDQQEIVVEVLPTFYNTSELYLKALQGKDSK